MIENFEGIDLEEMKQAFRVGEALGAKWGLKIAMWICAHPKLKKVADWVVGKIDKNWRRKMNPELVVFLETAFLETAPELTQALEDAIRGAVTDQRAKNAEPPAVQSAAESANASGNSWGKKSEEPPFVNKPEPTGRL